MSASTNNLAVIQLCGVRKSYKTGEVEVEAVRGVDLEVHRGEFVAVMGASGSGKSTLMNIIGCLDKASGGNYLLDGVDVAGRNRKQLAALRNHKLGFVFQSFNLLARTSALENVELPLFYTHPLGSLRERRQRAKEALEKVGLANRSGHHPSQLSGGQQQRIAIARALVNKPELVLADEPTGNLDPSAKRHVVDLLFQQIERTGSTLLMVTHDTEIAARFPRVINCRDFTAGGAR